MELTSINHMETGDGDGKQGIGETWLIGEPEAVTSCDVTSHTRKQR